MSNTTYQIGATVFDLPEPNKEFLDIICRRMSNDGIIHDEQSPYAQVLARLATAFAEAVDAVGREIDPNFAPIDARRDEKCGPITAGLVILHKTSQAYVETIRMAVHPVIDDFSKSSFVKKVSDDIYVALSFNNELMGGYHVAMLVASAQEIQSGGMYDRNKPYLYISAVDEHDGYGVIDVEPEETVTSEGIDETVRTMLQPLLEKPTVG